MMAHLHPICVGLVACVACIAVDAHAQSIHVVRPVPGFVCKKLNITEREAMSPDGGGVSIRTAPAAAAPAAALAPSVLFVRSPEHIVAGFVEVMRLDGQLGWIEQSRVKPFDPSARCVPSLMSNGRIGPG